MLELPLQRYVFVVVYCGLLLTFFALVGLPAFKPGEKVEIDLGMDDI